MTSRETTTIRTLNELLPGEIETYFKDGGDLAIIPIGSIEHHGPHLINGCDGYITLAKAQEVARRSGGVLFPMISFCWEGATNVYSGGIGVREELFIDYLRAVVRAVRHAGFKRIVILNSHGGNFYAMRAFPQHCLREEGIAVLTVYGSAGCPEADRARKEGVGEAAALLGALHLLGQDDIVDEIVEYTRKALEEFGDRRKVDPAPASMQGARRLGVVGQDYFEEYRHAQPDSRQTSAEPGAKLIRKIAEHIVKHLPTLSDHVKETETPD